MTPANAIDIAGRTYGHLTVLRLDGTDATGRRRWACRCECGKERVVRGDNLKTGHTGSCGCHQYDHLKERRQKRAWPRSRRARVSGWSDWGTW